MDGHQRVQDVMHRGVVACTPETRVTKIVHTMNDQRIHALVVVDACKEPVGIISQADLLNAGFDPQGAERFEEMVAGQLMTTPVIAVGPYASIEDAVQIMQRHHIHRLLVVAAEGTDPKHPIGILSETDLVRYLGSAYSQPSVAAVEG